MKKKKYREQSKKGVNIKIPTNKAPDISTNLLSKYKNGNWYKSLIFGKQPDFPADHESQRGLIPVKDIRDGIIITTDNRYIKVLEILPVNFYLKSAIEQQNIIHYFASYLKIAPSNLQIIVQTGKADIKAYYDNMERLYNEERNSSCREMIYENAELVNYLAVNEAITHRFFLVFQHENNGASSYEAIIQSLNDHANNAAAYLDFCGLEVIAPYDYDDFLTSLFIRGKGNNQNDGNTVIDRINHASADISNKEFIIVDDVYYSYLYVTGYGYNTQNCLAWLAPFVEAGDGISFSFSVEKLRKDKVLPKIAKTTMLNRSRMREVGDTRSDYEQLDDAIGAGMYIKDEMNRNGEEFYCEATRCPHINFNWV